MLKAKYNQVRWFATAASITIVTFTYIYASVAQSVSSKQEETKSTFALISDEDLARSAVQSDQLDAKQTGANRSACNSSVDTGAPAIKVIAPDIGHPVHAPVDIELAFSSEPGIHVVPSTFRVCYLGFVTIEITDRLVGHSTLTDTGLQAKGATLPNGIYHLRLLLQDNLKRTGKTEITIHVY
jgi:hypothetical protein